MDAPTGLPPPVLADEGILLTPNRRLTYASFQHLFLLPTTLLTGGLGVFLVAADRQGWHWSLILAGLAVTVTALESVNFLIQRWKAVTLAKRLILTLREHLSASGQLPPGFNGKDALLSFAPYPRVFDGLLSAWDLGFLQITPQALHFAGDKCSFSLKPEAVTSARPVRLMKGIWGAELATPSVPSGRIMLICSEKSNFLLLGRSSREGALKLTAWKQAPGAALDATAMDLGPPPRVEDYGHTLKSAQVKKSLWISLAVRLAGLGVIGGLMGALLGWPLPWRSVLMMTAAILAHRLGEMWYLRTRPDDTATYPSPEPLGKQTAILDRKTSMEASKALGLDKIQSYWTMGEIAVFYGVMTFLYLLR